MRHSKMRHSKSCGRADVCPMLEIVRRRWKRVLCPSFVFDWRLMASHFPRTPPHGLSGQRFLPVRLNEPIPALPQINTPRRACFIDRASNIVMPPPNLYHDPQHSQPGPIHKIGGGNDGAELGLYCHHGSPCHRHVCVWIRRSFVRGRCHPGRMPATPRMVILKTNVFGVMRHTYWTCGPPWAPVHLEVWSDE